MKFEKPRPEALKHLTFLVIGWFVLCVLVGLYRTFDLLVASKEPSQTSVMFKGLKISGVMFITGFIVPSSIIAFFLLNKKREP